LNKLIPSFLGLLSRIWCLRWYTMVSRTYFCCKLYHGYLFLPL